MDIATLVNYERIYPLKITYPNSDRWTGITVGLRSESSERAKAVVRKHLNDSIQGKGRQRKPTAEAAEGQELERTASTIAWWKWEVGDPSDEAKFKMDEARKEGKSEEEIAKLSDATQATYNGSSDPELTMENAIVMLRTLNWFYSQIKVGNGDVENFMGETPTKDSATSSPS